MISTFERIEKKYLLNPEQHAGMLRALKGRMHADEYGLSTLLSLYLDTDDDLLIRRSIEKPKYKEKVRLRSYGVPRDGDRVFLELKKKSQGVVYKRRIALTAGEAMAYLLSGQPPSERGQIFRELDYAVKRYSLKPALVLAYDRVAYAEDAPSPNALRITMDQAVRSRVSDLDLRLGGEGEELLPPGMRLMEIKIAQSMPLWLCRALSEYQVYPTSFSKYGRAYALRRMAAPRPLAAAREAAQTKGGFRHAFSPV